MPDEVRRLVLVNLKELEKKNMTFQDVVKTCMEAHEDGFSPRELLEAGRLMKREVTRLKKFNLSIPEAVDYCLAYYRPPEIRKRFDEVAEQFLKDRSMKGCREKTMKGYRSFVRVVTHEFGEEEIDHIQQTDIEDWISESPYAPRTRANYIMTLSTIFNFAKKRKWCWENPATNISRPILDDKPPGILTPMQAAAILQAALDHQPEHVAGFAIGLFAGLRVSELCALDWSEIYLDRRMIEVKAAKAKTRQRRLVHISDNLAAWLAPYAECRGPVFYREVDGIKELLGPNRFGKDCRWLVGSDQVPTEEYQPLPVIVSPWPHNAIRHSFGSYYLGLTRNEQITASEMGNSPAMVFKHYREIVHPEDVDRYWKIMPPGGVANVVPVRPFG